MPRVMTGLDRLANGDPQLRPLVGRRIAALVHHASVDANLRHAVPLLEAMGASVPLLFGPEHGLWSTHQDMEAVPSNEDPVFHRPVLSLYGDDVASLAPPPGALDEVEAVVADLVDIGARYYTYAATVVAMGRACARRGVPLFVLDRPNPLGGEVIEGGPLADGFESFVGALPVPHRHALTLAELVRLGLDGVDVDLVVVACQGWQRGARFEETGLPWVPPSPNMPSLAAAALYPGLCFVEGTTLSEGRGTTTPFEVVGAPGVDPIALAGDLAQRGLPGVAFRPHLFRPQFGKHAGHACGGVQLVVTDAAALEPLALGAHLLMAFRCVAPEAFGWREEAYEFVDDIPAIDLLAGDEELRARVDEAAPLEPLLARWQAAAAAEVARRLERSP